MRSHETKHPQLEGKYSAPDRKNQTSDRISDQKCDAPRGTSRRDEAGDHQSRHRTTTDHGQTTDLHREQGQPEVRGRIHTLNGARDQVLDSRCRSRISLLSQTLVSVEEFRFRPRLSLPLKHSASIPDWRCRPRFALPFKNFASVPDSLSVKNFASFPDPRFRSRFSLLLKNLPSVPDPRFCPRFSLRSRTPLPSRILASVQQFRFRPRLRPRS